MISTGRPYETEADKEAETKPTPVPDDPAEESKNIEENGEPLGGNIA